MASGGSSVAIRPRSASEERGQRRLERSPRYLLALGRLRVGRIRAVERIHIRDHGIELVGLEHLAPWRHPLLEHAVDHGLVDLLEGPAVEPVIVGEVRADLAAAIEAMTRGAVGREGFLAEGQRGIGLSNSWIPS